MIQLQKRTIPEHTLARGHVRSSCIPRLRLLRSQGPAAQGWAGTHHTAARQSTVPRLRPRCSHRCVPVPTDSQRRVPFDSGQVLLLSRCQERGQRGSDRRSVQARVPLPPALAGGDGEGQSQGTAPGPLPASRGLRLRLVLHWGRAFVFESPAGSSSKDLSNRLLNRYDFWDPFGQ